MNFQPEYGILGGRTWITFNHSVFDTDMNTSPLYGGYVGLRFNPNVSADLGYDFRGQYHWDRISTLDGTLGVNPARQVGERYIAHNIRIQTLLLAVNLNPDVNWGGFIPYVTAGVGAAWNRIGSFENTDIATPSRVIPTTFDILVSGKTTTNFAWKVGVGVDYACIRWPQLHFNIAYRFVDVGILQTGTALFETFSRIRSTINPFKARHVQFNELFVGASYHFD